MATVEYWVATYHGTVIVPCAPDDDDAVIIARVKAKLAPLPLGYARFEIIERA